MRKKIDTQAAKQRKQKMILAVGGALFLLLAVIQGPKLWKQLHPPAPPAAAHAAASAAPSGTGTGATGSATQRVTSKPAVSAPAGQTAQLAGIAVVPEQPVEPETGQLDSFSEFSVKDPFVPQIEDAVATSTASASSPKAATPSPKPAASSAAGAVAGAAPGSGLGGTAGAPTLAAPTAAILKVNGALQALALKDLFPKRDKTFVLVSLKRGSAKIGVAAGGFYTTGSKTITLQVGKKVTLLNTATGVRYVIKLVYVGADAPQLTAFTTAAPAKAK